VRGRRGLRALPAHTSGDHCGHDALRGQRVSLAAAVSFGRCASAWRSIVLRNGGDYVFEGLAEHPEAVRP
jgi:hypothetical protein